MRAAAAIALLGAAACGDNIRVIGDEDTNGAPAAAPDSYAAVGNTTLVVGASEGVLANDVDPDGDDIAVVDLGAITTALGGQVTLEPDGSFVYAPPAGETAAADGFEYAITDSVETATGAVTIELDRLIWYVDNTAAAGGHGTLAAPFAILGDAESASNAGDIIYVFEGDGATTGQDAGISLQADQQLIGGGVVLELDGEILIPAARPPAITNTAGVAVALADGNRIAGLIIDEPAAAGVSGAAITSLAIDAITVNAGGDTAIAVANDAPTGPVSIAITDCVIDGTGAAAITRSGIDVEVGAAGGDGALDLAITGCEIAEVEDAVAVRLEGATGTGGGGPNLVTIGGNTINDFTGTAVFIDNDGGSINRLAIQANTIDAVVDGGLTPVGPGLDIRVAGEIAGAAVDLTVAGNTIRDVERECIFVNDGNDAGNVAVLTALFDGNTIDNCRDQGLRINPDAGAVTYNVTAIDNAITATGLPSTFIWGVSATAGATMRLHLADNDDSSGYVFGCNASTTTEVASLNNAGGSFTCPTDQATFLGELADLGNTRNGGAPTGFLNGAGTADLVDPAAIPVP